MRVLPPWHERLPSWFSGEEPACQAGDKVRSLGWESSLGEEMETHSSILAWEIPWTKRSFSRMEETRGLQNPQRFSNGYSEIHIIAENKPMLLLLLCSNAYQNLSRGRGVMKTKGNKRGGGIWLVQQCYLTYLCDQIRLNFLIIRIQKTFIVLG